jgi:TolA-binding protein
MNIRRQFVAPVLCGAALVAACEERRTTEQDDLARAREQAAEEIREAQEEVAEAQKKAAAKVEEAERKLREHDAKVGADVEKDRTTYTNRIKDDLEDIDEDIADLREESQKATGETKREIDLALARIDQKRKALDGEVTKIEATSANDWTAFRERMEASIKELKKDIDDADDRWKRRGKT